jgi:Arylsulfotransferase (ASST)
MLTATIWWVPVSLDVRLVFPNGSMKVSARVMNSIYKISGKDGSIIWRLGGKLTDFAVDPAAEFALQHDARWIDDKKQDRMTLFDNGPHGDIGFSRGLLLGVDQNAKSVRLLTEFRNELSTFGQFEGSLQALNPSDPNTNFMVGFGLAPFFTEFSSNGTVLLDGQFGTATLVNNYRTYKLPWQGKPLSKPSINWDTNSGKVHLSWNGATDHDQWVRNPSASILPVLTSATDLVHCGLC